MVIEMTIKDIDSKYKPKWSFTLDASLRCSRKLDLFVPVKMNSKAADVLNRGRQVITCPVCRRRVVLPCDMDILAFRMDVNNVEFFYEKFNQNTGHFLNPKIEMITMRKG